MSNKMSQCIRAQGLVFTSGHTSLILGRLGEEVSTAQGASAAREAILRLLHSLREYEGTLDGLYPVQLNVCINSSLDFKSHGEVADGASEVLQKVFADVPAPSRKALGMSSLPRGVAVEIDAVFADLAIADNL